MRRCRPTSTLANDGEGKGAPPTSLSAWVTLSLIREAETGCFSWVGKGRKALGAYIDVMGMRMGNRGADSGAVDYDMLRT